MFFKNFSVVFLCLFSFAVFAEKGVYEVKMHNGTPTLFMEGKPYFAPTSIQGNIHRKIIKDFAGQDLHVYSLLCHFADDPAEVIKRMETIVSWDPDARFILRIGLLLNTKQATLKNPVAVKWFKDNPPSAAGENQVTYLKLRTRPDEQKLYSETPSVASEKYMQFALPIYRNYINALEKSSCGSRIAIYWPAYHEGNYAYSFGGPVFFSDYSPSMIQKFRAMLKRKYKNNVQALQKAWNEPAVTFETAQPATPWERLNSTDMSLRDPLKHQKVIDFEECLTEVISRHILTFLAETKKLTNRKKVTGTYACYLGGWLSSGGDWEQKAVTSYRQAAGHLDVLPYYNSPDVDLIGSPHSYIYRGAGESTVISMAHSSWKLRNKLFFWEDDTRTSVMALFDQVGSCKTVAETNEVLKRNFGYNLAKGYMYWLPGHYFGYAGCDDPDIMTMLGKCREIGMKSLDFERDSNADVALVVDDKSIFRCGIQPQMYGPLTEMHNALSTAGISYDNILLADMANPALKNYKLYVFFDSVYIVPEMRKAISRKLAANGASALWFYAPGYVTDNGYSLESIAEITGIKVDIERKYARHHIRMTSDDPQFRNVKGQTFNFRTDVSKKTWGPLFYINDSSAKILGVVAENGKPGFAMKKNGNTTHFYSTVPGLNNEVIRSIAKIAGVHVYTEKNDAVFPGKNFLVLHSAFDGEHTIKLPEKGDFYEVFDEKLIAKNVSEIKLNLKKGETKLFFTGNHKLWKPGRKVVYVNSDSQSVAREYRNMFFTRKPDAQKCFFVDLSKIAGHYNTSPQSKEGQKNIPVGRQTFANVPFFMLDPAKGPVCVTLRGNQHPYLAASAPDIAVDKKVSYFYFLHQAGWANRDYNTTTLEYIIKYTDGTEVRVPVHAHAEIADSVNGGVLKKTGLENREAKVAHIYFGSKRYPDCALYAYRFKNPYRRKTVKSIGFSSEKNTGMAVPAIYAVTLELAQ